MAFDNVANETPVNGIYRSKSPQGPGVWMASTSVTEEVVTKTLVDAGAVGVALVSEGKVGVYGGTTAYSQQLFGLVNTISGPFTDVGAEDQPAIVEVMIHAGYVGWCKYDTAQAPAVGSRVVLTSTSGHYGEVRISPVTVSTAEDTVEGAQLTRKNVVLELDTVNFLALICLM